MCAHTKDRTIANIFLRIYVITSSTEHSVENREFSTATGM